MLKPILRPQKIAKRIPWNLLEPFGRNVTNLMEVCTDFQWVAGEDGLGKVLQVSFTSVPEPAELAVLIGAIALSMAVFRRRR